MGGQREASATEKPQRARTWSAPWSFISSLQNCEKKIHVCGLTQPVWYFVMAILADTHSLQGDIVIDKGNKKIHRQSMQDKDRKVRCLQGSPYGELKHLSRMLPWIWHSLWPITARILHFTSQVSPGASWLSVFSPILAYKLGQR